MILLSICCFSCAECFADFNVIHPFLGGTTDGAGPESSVISDGSYLYGTTVAGGTANKGTVYRLSPDGSNFEILHDFAGGTVDGFGDDDGLLLSGGSTLYGLTGAGGANNDGIVYSINTDGAGYTILHTFAGTPDGSEPARVSLIQIGTTLYGTASAQGSSSNGGTLFEMQTNGSGFQVLHTFANNPDGGEAFGGLTAIGNELYGITRFGGASGQGTIYKIGADGTGYSVMHSFSFSDGGAVNESLAVNGSTLYGTTENGGTAPSGETPDGTIFSINADGSGFQTVYQFVESNSTPYNPVGTIAVANGSLFGAAYRDGEVPYGMTYSVALNGTGFTTTHVFANGSDGSTPFAGLTAIGGDVYGESFEGGENDVGALFELDVPEPQGAPLLLGLAAAMVTGRRGRRGAGA